MAQKRWKAVVFGCGNRLLGDDGFGPATIEALKAGYPLPGSVTAIDAGTTVREYLFDYLLADEHRPEKIIILNAVDIAGKRPGSLFLLGPGELPPAKIHDYSLHQFQGVNLLAELAEQDDTDVAVLACQVASLPESIETGLSGCLRRAVPRACERVLQLLAASS